MSLAPASVAGGVYLRIAGTDVVGLGIGPDRRHGDPISGDLHARWPSITGFLGATPKAAAGMHQTASPVCPSLAVNLTARNP